MNAINIKGYIEQGIKTIEVAPNDAIIWDDIVTGTKYFLDNRYYRDIKLSLYNDIKNLGYEEQLKVIDDNKKINVIPWKEAVGRKNTFFKPTFRDCMKLYALFAYMFDGADKDNRGNIYIDFINETYKYKTAYKIVQSMAGKAIANEDKILLQQLKITLIKGGAFKVKKYYLENNKLKDMRGASALLTYVTETKIPEIINEKFINEALIYSGGGNVMCIVQNQNEAQNLCREFENTFDKYTLTVENAFSFYECDIYNFIENYKGEMRNLEAKIENRKKLKIYNAIKPKSQLNNKERVVLNGTAVEITAEELKAEKEVCELCSVRTASYKLDKDKEESKKVCGSCLHKHIIGSQEKLEYNKKFEEYIRNKYGKKEDKIYKTSAVGSIDDIDKKSGRVAVIYGDGNNIGAIIQNINSICEMMYFSRKIQNAANEAVYEAIFKNKGTDEEVFKFEIIAVGGDDIFFIAPAAKALGISKDLIDIFNNQFLNMTVGENENKYRATMSIGIAISKSSNDIRKLVEIAQDELKIAKKIERKLLAQGKNSGSVGIDFIKGSNYLLKESMNDKNAETFDSMLPMSNETFKDFIDLVAAIKRKKLKSYIEILDQASKEMEVSEFMLFYSYNEVKRQKDLTQIFEKKSISLCKFDKGFFTVNPSGKPCLPWGDILNFTELD